MSKRNIADVAALLVVAAVLAGAAWYRTQRSGMPTTRPAPRLPRLVDLGADKCVPCKLLAPILAELKTEYEGRLVVEFIDTWKNPEAQAPYDIRVIPTQILYDANGQEVWRNEGFISKEDLVAILAKKVGLK
ncbi:MAG: thioredoxin family protein [Phycisphaerae bacterium]